MDRFDKISESDYNYKILSLSFYLKASNHDFVIHQKLSLQLFFNVKISRETKSVNLDNIIFSVIFFLKQLSWFN